MGKKCVESFLNKLLLKKEEKKKQKGEACEEVRRLNCLSRTT